MAAVTAAMVKELRESTGAGMMEYKIRIEQLADKKNQEKTEDKR